MSVASLREARIRCATASCRDESSWSSFLPRPTRLLDNLVGQFTGFTLGKTDTGLKSDSWVEFWEDQV
jgi:hypothetical protein